jgi:hypothetical protein
MYRIMKTFALFLILAGLTGFAFAQNSNWPPSGGSGGGGGGGVGLSLGTPNGLTLNLVGGTVNVLSLGLSSVTSTGALSSSDFSNFENTFADGPYVPISGGTMTGNLQVPTMASVGTITVPQLQNPAGQVAIELRTYDLRDSINFQVLNWDNAQTYSYSDGGNASIDWNVRHLLDTAGTVILDWSGSSAKFTYLTANTALVSDGSDNLISSTTTATELGYVHGVTAAIQTQLNAAAINVTALQGATTSLQNQASTATLQIAALQSATVNVKYLVGTTANIVAFLGGVTSNLAALNSVTGSTTLGGYLNGLTSNVQTQLNTLGNVLVGQLGVVHTATFVTPGSSTPSTVWHYRIVGGGGGGGGANGAGAAGGGGGAGAYAEGTISGFTGGTTITVTTGGAGSAGSSAGGAGGTGGTSSIAATGITTITCVGGSGGTGSTSATASSAGGGAGGTVTGGSPPISMTGGSGSTGLALTTFTFGGSGRRILLRRCRRRICE